MDEKLNKLLGEWEGQKGSVIPLLQKVQELNGCLSQETMGEIARATGKSPAEIYGVATFYAQFRFTPVGEHIIKLCHGTACHVNGAGIIETALKEELGIETGETTGDGLFTIEVVACLGCCSLAPVVMIDDNVEGRLTCSKLIKILKKIKRNES